MVGYVNVLDGDFILEDREEEDPEYYYGSDSWGMDYPDVVPYVDGRDLRLESKELFLSILDRNVERTARITELEYKENQ
ncbi:hypothetical protein N7517_008977 [Penicillium concentricum]|uniref:Uncharacterized protein n=1 Tax=Penicillium concentricum TaxID=293559 RepID=A0A9W9UYR7_9EURO|nr:uncharacterized protein N7517_008977 [Penicillium concentricum]KAJ5359786.1 hypothetical protein N7517_008977 [Penicillium concentricum]